MWMDLFADQVFGRIFNGSCTHDTSQIMRFARRDGVGALPSRNANSARRAARRRGVPLAVACAT